MNNSAQYKILSYNIDTNIGRCEEGPARVFKQWRANERQRLLIKTLEQIFADATHPDIIHIQECRLFINKFGEVVDSVTPIKNFLVVNGYTVLESQYNPSDRSFIYMTAFLADKFDLVSKQVKYFTATPDEPTVHPDMKDMSIDEQKEIIINLKKHNFGEEWERSTFIVELKDKLLGNTIHCFNVHVGLSPAHRIACSELIDKFAKEIICRSSDKIIVTGDFNTFPDQPEETKQQLEKLATNMTEVSQPVLPNGAVADFSFIYFPYDYGANDSKYRSQIENTADDAKRELMVGIYKENAAIGGLLDRIFYYGFNTAVSKLLIVPLYNDLVNYTDAEMHKYVLAHVDHGPAFASDHQPILAIFE